eukprot:3350818-Rhodomonas_salina.1
MSDTTVEDHDPRWRSRGGIRRGKRHFRTIPLPTSTSHILREVLLAPTLDWSDKVSSEDSNDSKKPWPARG